MMKLLGFLLQFSFIFCISLEKQNCSLFLEGHDAGTENQNTALGVSKLIRQGETGEKNNEATELNDSRDNSGQFFNFKYVLFWRSILM